METADNETATQGNGCQLSPTFREDAWSIGEWIVLLQIEYLGVYKGGVNAETIGVGEFPVSAALIMLVIDCVVYLLLAVYFHIAIGGDISFFYVMYTVWRTLLF